jgi:hypothetical protein
MGYFHAHHNPRHARHYQRTIECVRIHESGHAVAALALGFAVHDIEVDGYHRNGAVQTGMTREAPIAEQLIILHAGLAAEDKFWPQRPGRSEYSERADMNRARALVAGNPRGSEMLDEGRRRAEQIVGKHWAAIEALAARLKDGDGTLSGAEAVAIVRATSPSIGAEFKLPELTSRGALSRTAGQLRIAPRTAATKMPVTIDGTVIGSVERHGKGYAAIRNGKCVGVYGTLSAAARAV